MLGEGRKEVGGSRSGSMEHRWTDRNLQNSDHGLDQSAVRHARIPSIVFCIVYGIRTVERSQNLLRMNKRKTNQNWLQGFWSEILEN